MTLLFKYVRPHSVKHVLKRKNEISLRFAYPQEYNDPYELFLQADGLESDEHRGFFKQYLGKIDDFPIACFSRLPDSVVMWAHYAIERSGICLGFDEDVLTDQFRSVYVKDVSYTDKPAQIDGRLVAHAATTMKFRHGEMMLNQAYGAAYFTKRADWAYEKERRIVVDRNNLKETKHGLTARLPVETLKYVIIGDRTPKKIARLCRSVARRHNIPLLHMRLGKVSYQPFFVQEGCFGVLMWDGTEFVEPDVVCNTCGEPVTSYNDDFNCDLCAMSDEDSAFFAQGSMLSLVTQYGLAKITVSFNGAELKGFDVPRAIEESIQRTEAVEPTTGVRHD